MSFKGIIIAFLFTIFYLPSPMSAPPIHPDPAIAPIQTLYRTPPATIPAFREQPQSSSCPLDLPENLFHDIKLSCLPKPHHSRPDPDFYSGQLHRSRCCPVLAAWLYSAYSETGLGVAATAKAQPRTASYEMPDLPDDSETCVDTLQKALGDRDVALPKPNGTCDAVYCNCGIRLHPFSCPEAFRVNGRGQLVGGEAVERLEKDCFHLGDGGGLAVCSKCLGSLYLLYGHTDERINRTERSSKMQSQDCELMGLTWLLNKNRSAYIHTVSAVLRAIMMKTDDDASHPRFCSPNSDGMPLAVDSADINNQSSSTILVVRLYLQLLPLSLFCMSILVLFCQY